MSNVYKKNDEKAKLTILRKTGIEVVKTIIIAHKNLREIQLGLPLTQIVLFATCS